MLTIGVSGKKGKEKTFPNYFDKMTKKTKIGLIQLKISKSLNLNIKKAISKIRVASNKGAKIICVPELFLSQYFCQTEKHSNFKLAEKIPNKTTDIFCKIAKELSVILILSLFANRDKFFAGSIPKIFLNFNFLNGFSATPSLLPTSII